MSNISVTWNFDKDEEHILTALDENESVVCCYGVFTRDEMEDYAVMHLVPTGDENNPLRYDILSRGTKEECIDKFGDIIEIFIGIRCIHAK